LFFFLLFLAGIASQYWITPFGPAWLGVSWGPLGFILLIFTLLFIVPSPYERSAAKASGEVASTTAAISIFMWLLLIMLFVAILLGIFVKPAS
jgi:hypothetical protein